MARLIALGVVLLVAAPGCLGDGQSGVEKTVMSDLQTKKEYAGIRSVSCAKDHTLIAEGRTAVAYRCFPQGGAFDGIETCVYFRGDRLLSETEMATVPISYKVCEGQA
jgi:hypothetical protein